MSAVAIDERIKTGAYVREGTTVYLVVGQELDVNNGITGRYDLESITGVHCSGHTWVHNRIHRTATELAKFDLVIAAPRDGVPEYLDAQITEHFQSLGIEF